MTHLIRAVTLLACLAAPVFAEPHLTLTSRITWEASADWFGGWSGTEVTDDGQTIVLISDKGRMVRTAMQRDADGVLRGLSQGQSSLLRAPDGSILTGEWSDAEGLAIAGNGRAFISFEHAHRVAPVSIDTGKTGAALPLPFQDDLQLNSGLEALAIDTDGTVYTLPERSGAKRRPFPLYAYKAGRWQTIGKLPRRGPFLPVGADFDDTGRFWLLERAATPLGFRSRIRLFDLTRDDLTGATVMTTGPGQYDNLEAISLWRSDSGQLHVTLVSDDNFLRIQQTQIVEFAVTE
ncbi:esterase-like activity of phytase family protein [Sulfitobacter sp. S190]|uniref:esterase-like activity of phytase family protein n=1 Tax=Sulfitobacter sp. S190 TaxID=2867022 RepID=UPI0021A7C3F5|nr:esterase-like activity of phytase family protein [Sulfitobacter sp. S190]UWR22323.1 esterase-like activity of phytase family protein [Sulfitobacter sp. S190]